MGYLIAYIYYIIKYATCQVNFVGDKGTVLLSLSANFIITADAFASATIFGVEKRMGVILNHLGFFENPEGEESLFAACLTKNGIYGKIERRERRKKDLYVI